MQIDNNLVEDLDEFLDAQYELKEGETIMSDDTANYYVSCVKKNNEQKKSYAELAKTLKASYAEKIDLWLEQKLRTIDNDSDRRMRMLEDYFHMRQPDNTKKVRLPEGNIGFYKGRDSVKFSDDEKLVEYLADNPGTAGYVVTRQEVDTKALRKDIEYVEIETDEGVYVTCAKVGGIVIPENFTTITRGGTTFNVK